MNIVTAIGLVLFVISLIAKTFISLIVRITVKAKGKQLNPFTTEFADLAFLKQMIKEETDAKKKGQYKTIYRYTKVTLYASSIAFLMIIISLFF